MKDVIFDQFQNTVSELLITHKSILDVQSKFQEATARVNRAISKSVTTCGCVEIEAKKQNAPPDVSLKELSEFMDHHLRGQICEHCREIIEKELGNTIFYIAAMCNLLDISLYDTIVKEYKKVNTLGVYNLR